MNLRHKSANALTLAVSLFLTAAKAEDWTEFRGPTGQGIASGRLPTEWGPTKNVVWKQAIPGRGWSSPIIVKGRVYLTTAIPAENGSKDISLRCLCLDAKSGKVVWDTEIFRPNAGKIPAYYDRGSYANPTPLTDGRRLYVSFGHLGMAALDLEGKILWRNTDLSFYPGFGSNASCPVLLDEALILSCDGQDKQFVVALDSASGKKLLWKTPRSKTPTLHKYKNYAFTTPLIIEVKGKKQVVSPAAGAVYSYDPQTGQELWRVHYGNGYSVVPRPVFGHGLLFVISGYDTPSLLAIRPDGQGDVTASHVVWTARKGVPLIASPLLLGDELYLASTQGMATCLNAKTGKVHWQERLGGVYYASPLAANGKVYFQNEEGIGTVVKASRRSSRWWPKMRSASKRSHPTAPPTVPSTSARRSTCTVSSRCRQRRAFPRLLGKRSRPSRKPSYSTSKRISKAGQTLRTRPPRSRSPKSSSSDRSSMPLRANTV